MGYFKVDSVRMVSEREDIWRVIGQFDKSRMLEIDIFWFSQYSTMGPLAILTPKLSETQAETNFKVLGWFNIGPQSIRRDKEGRDTFSDLDDTLTGTREQAYEPPCLMNLSSLP